MIKKFECRDCNKQFDVDDNSIVVCPYCHSDNVEPAHFHLPSWVSYLGLAFVLCLVGLMIWRFWGSIIDTASKPPIDEPNPELPVEITDPPTVEVCEPVFDGENYTVTAVAKQVPSNKKYYYVRMNHFGDKQVLQKSTDGHFADIPYNEESGNSYDFAIMDAKADTLLCDPVPITGFIRQKVVNENERMTIEQLQRLIDGKDQSLLGVGGNDYLAPDYTLGFQGLNPDESTPASFSDVYINIELGIWSEIKVVTIDYDDNNRINHITLRVKPA